ncbi:hypothetical protein [Roseateles cavernae]|uniref:hypothetical protein n=1 Tax=Roseateles cavernae TaxID=3153578 RepID=UPI0032E3E0F9
MRTLNKTLLLGLLAGALLSACGGSDHDDTVVASPPAGPAEVPDSALASSASFTQFAIEQSQTGSDSAEPLGADKVSVPPSSETDEPVSLG